MINTETFESLRNNLPGRLVITHRPMDHRRLDSELLGKLVRQLLCPWLRSFRHIVKRYICAVSGESSGNRSANSILSPRTSDEGGLARERKSVRRHSW